MNARNQLLANRVREVFLNGRWIANTNYKEQLLSIRWQQAVKQFGTLNSIAALTYHINYYLAGLIKVFQGGPLDIRDKYSFDMPEIQSAESWNELVELLLSNSEKFAAEVERMEDNKLDEPFVEEKYGTYLRNIEGVIEHSYYHLGQVSLIMKLTSEQSEGA
jgi:uncharacterized damage-inducible protein DinB